MSHTTINQATLPYCLVLLYSVDESGCCRCPKGQACPTPGKHPLPGIWAPDEATPEPFRQHGWRPLLPAYFQNAVKGVQNHYRWAPNYGISPIPGQMLVVDIDVKRGNGMGFARQHFPDWFDSNRYTVQVRTPSNVVYPEGHEYGHHLYFQGHPRLQVGTRKLAGLHIDLFTGHSSRLSQVVIPGSRTNLGTYQWVPGHEWEVGRSLPRLTETEVDTILTHLTPEVPETRRTRYRVEDLQAVPPIDQLDMPEWIRELIRNDHWASDSSDHCALTAEALYAYTELSEVEAVAILSNETYAVASKSIKNRGAGPVNLARRAEWVQLYQTSRLWGSEVDRIRLRDKVGAKLTKRLTPQDMFTRLDNPKTPVGAIAAPTEPRVPPQAPVIAPVRPAAELEDRPRAADEGDAAPKALTLGDLELGLPPNPYLPKASRDWYIALAKKEATEQESRLRDIADSHGHRLATFSTLYDGTDLVAWFVVIDSLPNAVGWMGTFGPRRGDVVPASELGKHVKQKTMRPETVQGAGGEPVEQTSIHYFQENARHVTDVIYAPNEGVIVERKVLSPLTGTEVSALYYNVWRGFRTPDIYRTHWGAEKYTKDMPAVKSVMQDIERLIYVLTFTTNDLKVNHQQFRWFICWLASAFLFPQERVTVQVLHVCLSEGLGRGLLMRILQAALGIANARSVDTLEALFEPFTAGSGTELIVGVEEVGMGRNLKEFNKLKALLTAGTKEVNKKYGAKYEVENLTRYLFMSNNAQPLPMDNTGRRFFVMHHPWDKRITGQEESPVGKATLTRLYRLCQEAVGAQAREEIDGSREPLSDPAKNISARSQQLLGYALWAVFHKHFDASVDLHVAPNTLGIQSLAMTESASAHDFTATAARNYVVRATNVVRELGIEAVTQGQLLKLIEWDARENEDPEPFDNRGQLEARVKAQWGAALRRAVHEGHAWQRGHHRTRWLDGLQGARTLIAKPADPYMPPEEVRDHLLKAETHLLEHGLCSFLDKVKDSETRDAIVASAKRHGYDWSKYQSVLLSGLPQILQ